MPPLPLLAGLAGLLLAAFAGGVLVGRQRHRSRLRRVSDGVAELARGNLAHRVILPGDDDAARMAEDLNRLADAVQLERETAAAREAARHRLLTNISHDLRTPITSVAGYVDALRRGLGDEPERYLEVLALKTDELAALTDDLFYASRLDAGDLELQHQRMDLAEAVRRAVLGFEPQLAGKGVLVDIALREGRCIVMADPSAVSRILANVVSNGLRHGTGMTRFAVAMSEDAGAWVVRVSNDGPPLPDDADRLFLRGVTGPSGGAGLGLSIARELAERMGARVGAENAADGGVAFTLAFPKAAEPAASA
jgi:two-component system, OmpR family, phosphate regulon sensor histidine kinase PhoR